MPQWIYSWKFGSQTAKALARHMGIKRIRHARSRFKGRSNKVVINYGCSALPPEIHRCSVINAPECVAACSNKITFFQTVTQARTPDWTTDWETAAQWDKIVCRTILSGHSGSGIVITDSSNPVPAPLYTRYQGKDEEYRVHIVGGEIIDFARKARRHATPDHEVNWQIRTHKHGFVYVRGNVTLPEDARRQALLAFSDLGLDFAAIDVIVKRDTAWVLEANSAPGMTGQTLENYSQALRRLISHVG